MKNIVFVIIMVLFSILLTSCAASTPQVDEQDIIGYKLPVMPTDSTAVVYVIRPDQTVIGNLGAKHTDFGISIDGFSQAIPNASVVVFILKPGEHTIVAKSENKSETLLNAQAGRIYFYQINTKLGWVVGRVQTESLDEVTGTYQVKQFYEEEETPVLNLQAFSAPQ